MNTEELIRMTDRGLYCAAGDFHIDPCRPVGRAVITHAHADHARSGSRQYWCSTPGLGLTRARVGYGGGITAMDYGQPFTLGGARVSLHPAGHVLGSAQVRVEVGGRGHGGPARLDLEPGDERRRQGARGRPPRLPVKI